MPNVPVADLAIEMTRIDSLRLGTNGSYLITVGNNGPNEEPGPITVTNTLPPQLAYVSAGGAGWSCSASGQTVTCVYSGAALAPGTYAPALTLTVSVTSASTSVTNVATVSGARFDNVSENNSASDTASVLVPGYVFTDSPCSHNVAFGSPGQCTIMNWGPQTAAQALDGIYITNLNNSGVPTRLHASQVRTETMQFALTCHNPATNAGVRAAFSAVSAALPLCAPNGATPSGAYWSSTTGNSNNISFPGGSPSAGPYTFNYADVGRVELFMKRSASSSAEGSSGSFVVRPHGFVLNNIRCTTANADSCGGGALPTGLNPGAIAAGGPTFIRAGHPFSVTVTARNAAGAATPNYGRESPPETVRLVPTVTGAGGPNSNPAIGGSFGSFNNGVATGTNFTWNEVGIIRLTPGVGDEDYLGAGDVVGTQSGTVGRFFPHHFSVSGTLTTRSQFPQTVTTGSIAAGGTTLVVASAANIAPGHPLTVAGAGPAGADLNATVTRMSGTALTLAIPAATAVSNAAVIKPLDPFTYMGEPMMLQLQVRAHSASGTVTQNYADTYARLHAATVETAATWFATGCSGTAMCFGLGAVNGTTAALTPRLARAGGIPSSAWTAGVGSFQVAVLLSRPTSTVADMSWGPYEDLRFGAAPRDTDGVSLPTQAQHLAHGMDMDADLNNTPERRELFSTSSRLGRLRIASAHGSELLPLPIGLSAQYWNGTSFVTNHDDNNTRFGSSAVALSNFRGQLDPGETSVASIPSSIVLAAGRGAYTLTKPSGGDGRYGGSVDMTVGGLAFLPGNVGRARFGIVKRANEVVHLRENF
ncbi:MAG TPA: DUF11 domain-containing protein [Noviherbaspirillum sp.]|nr:DUF11 domain-containing protein [Noviherbaspirillum sp.]